MVTKVRIFFTAASYSCDALSEHTNHGYFATQQLVWSGVARKACRIRGNSRRKKIRIPLDHLRHLQWDTICHHQDGAFRHVPLSHIQCQVNLPLRPMWMRQGSRSLLGISLIFVRHHHRLLSHR
jgi:hypothetical protein